MSAADPIRPAQIIFCACPSRSAFRCIAIRCGEDQAFGERCECSCHDEDDEDDD